MANEFFNPSLLIGLALVVSACGTTPASEPAAAQLVGSSWLLEDIDGQGVLDRLQSTLSFENSLRIAGSGGCNRYFGNYTLVDSELEFGPLGSTMMACPEAVMDQEQRFLAALESTRRYRLDAETDLLYFINETGEERLRFSRMAP